MNTKIIVIIFAVVLLLIVWWQSAQVYVTPSEKYAVEQHSNVYSATGDTVYYFWTSKRHKEFFDIGESYQLYSNDETVVVSLFSVTFASSRPADIKLGFYLTNAEDGFMVLAPQYQVSKVQESNFTMRR